MPSTTVTPMTARSAEEAALIASVSLRQRKNSGTDLAIEATPERTEEIKIRGS